jgi:AmpD protein
MPDSSFSVDTSSGLIAPARHIASPNCDDRPDGECIDLLILHGISLPPGEFGTGAIEALFLNALDHSAHPYFEEIRGLEVSSHLLIDRQGALTQFVSFNDRAWHAGLSHFRGRSRCNDFAIGIELEGTDDTAYTDAQYATLGPVVLALCAAYPGIDARKLAAHSDVAPGRKTDPGPAFEWQRLYDALLRTASA